MVIFHRYVKLPEGMFNGYVQFPEGLAGDKFTDVTLDNFDGVCSSENLLLWIVEAKP